MAHNFTHSRVVIQQLARATARTPPSEENSPFEYVDRSLTILGRTSDVHSERMREEFLNQRDFIAHQIKEVEIKVDGRFNKVEKWSEDTEEKMRARFKEADDKMDRRFSEVDKKMDGRFNKLDKKIDEVDKKMRDYLNHMQKASRNFLRTRGWEEIYPVGSLDPHSGIEIPDYFPHNVRHFWRLKHHTQIDRLVYLIRFYKIQGYEEWGRDADSLEGYSGSDDSSEGTSESSRSPMPIPLEEAVRSNPEVAHRALGAQLGLAYDEIQRSMERAKELNQGQVIGKKRGRDDQASEERKKRGFNLSDLTEVTSPTEPRSS